MTINYLKRMADQFTPKKPSVTGYLHLQKFIKYIESIERDKDMLNRIQYKLMAERSTKRNVDKKDKKE